jgi:predicted dehydrogenase
MAYGGEWKKHPEYGVTMVAGWDADDKRAADSTNALGIKKAASIDEILDDKSITAVVISSETKYHAELAELAADAKKDIIMYKPLALTLFEADRIVRAVERNGVRFNLGYQMRVDPQNIKLRELILDKTIGPTYAYRRRHSLSTHQWNDFEHAWHNVAHLNRDIFADDSAHPIDMLNWIFGVPETVMAELSTQHNMKVPNDNGVALFKYPNGMIAEISCYFSCCASEPTTEVYGAKGTILQYYGDGPSTFLPRPAGQPGLKWFVTGDADWTDSQIPSPPGHGVRLGAQAKPFAEFLNGERGPICSVYEARNSLRMVLACYLSAREGKRVRIDDNSLYEIV